KGWDARKRAYCLKIQPATGSFARNLIYSTKPIPVYVSFEPSTGSTGNGMLNLDTSNADAASGIAIEILNAADRSKLVFSSEKKYHTASESSIEIPLIAHYKRTGTVKAGTANAAMTFVINQY
ncbi:fimbrial protein, partial [Klebsiella pneumoniae]|uniref:fimbrial protein n=1 Tax=Klebsiella pneumoniae TaxID=573 RepID=UPI0021696091